MDMLNDSTQKNKSGISKMKNQKYKNQKSLKQKAQFKNEKSK
jgi:hypothetical protein